MAWKTGWGGLAGSRAWTVAIGAGMGLAAWGPCGTARAQTAPEASPPPAVGVDATPVAVPVSAAPVPTPSNATALEEIVVTATKRTQSVRDVPATIDVLTGAKLEQKGARELKDFIDLVPGIKMADQTGDTPRKIAIRGVGPDDTTNQTVGTVLGDVPLSDPFGSYTVVDPDPWDLKTVEVLKGPQGTLFGASSLAGLIRYVPNDPDLGAWEGKAFADWVSVKEGGTEPVFGAALNVPVGETLAFRFSGIVQHDPGVIDNDTVGQHIPNADDTHKWTGRAIGLWKPVSQLTINAVYQEQQSHSDEEGFVTNTSGNFSRNDAPGPSPTHRAFGLASLDLRYAFSWATLVSLSAHQHKINRFNLDSTYTLPGESVAQTGVDVTHGLRDVEANGFVQELRLVSREGGPWNWIGGVYYSTYQAYLLSDIYVPNTANLGSLLGTLPILGTAVAGPDGVSVTNEMGSPLKAGERAAYGEVTRTLFHSLDITLGGRLYRTTVDGTVVSAGVLATALGVGSSLTENVAVQSEGFSPKLAFAWHATENFLVYASASKGFQFGGVNILEANLDNDPQTFKSSTLWNYEGGVRTDWFHRTLRFDLTAFYIDWKNAQVTEEDNLDVNTYVDNVGKVHSRGLEGSFRYAFPIKGLSVEVNAAVVDATTVVPYTNDAGTTVPTGTEIPNTSRFQAATTLAYSRRLGPWRTQSAFEYTHTNSSWNDIEHDHLLDARDDYNINFTLSRPDFSLAPAFTLVVNNLTNEKGIVSYRHGASAVASGAGVPVVYERPRTLELRFSLSF